jgi:hypothetical protein
LRARFEGAVEQLRLAAVQWNKAYPQLIRGEQEPKKSTILTGFGQRQWPSQEEFDKVFAPVIKAFEAFLREFQALHNALQPLVREYSSRREVVAGEGK